MGTLTPQPVCTEWLYQGGGMGQRHCVSLLIPRFGFRMSDIVNKHSNRLSLQEVAELARKVVLTGFVSVVKPGSMLQIVVAVSLSLCFQTMHARCCTSIPHAALLRLVL